MVRFLGRSVFVFLFAVCVCAWDSLKGFSLLTLVSGGVVCGEPWRGAVLLTVCTVQDHALRVPTAEAPAASRVVFSYLAVEVRFLVVTQQVELSTWIPARPWELFLVRGCK